MHRLLLVLATFFAAAEPASAGPWLRAPGAGFASVSSTARDDTSGEIGVYGEFGLRPGLTLGTDTNLAHSTGHALVFARLPLLSGTWLVSTELAAGAHIFQKTTAPMLRAGVLLGRGFHRGRIAGWFSTDARIEWRQGMGGPAWKLDATLGLNAATRVNPIINVETYLSPDRDFSWKVAPGLTFRAGNGRTWAAGLEHRSGGGFGLRFALWNEF